MQQLVKHVYLCELSTISPATCKKKHKYLNIIFCEACSAKDVEDGYDDVKLVECPYKKRARLLIDEDDINVITCHV